MKKKIFGALVVVAIAAMASFNMNTDALSSADYQSLLKKQNIEALASDTAGIGDTPAADFCKTYCIASPNYNCQGRNSVMEFTCFNMKKNQIIIC